jgi:hypothetical protein
MSQDQMQELISQSVQKKRVRALYANYLVTLPKNLVFAAIWAWITFSFVSLSALLTWLVALSIVVSIRFWRCHWHFKRKHWRRFPTRLENEFVIGSGVTGAVWGAGAWLLQDLPPMQHAMALFLVFGLASGAWH